MYPQPRQLYKSYHDSDHECSPSSGPKPDSEVKDLWINLKPGTRTDDLKIDQDGVVFRGQRTGGLGAVMAGQLVISPPNPYLLDSGTEILFEEETGVVTGVDTTFTQAEPGAMLYLSPCYYPISQIDSDTQLTLGKNYVGVFTKTPDYHILNTISNIRVENVIFRDTHIMVQSALNLVFENCRFENSTLNLLLCNNVTIKDCQGGGIYLERCSDVNLVQYRSNNDNLPAKENAFQLKVNNEDVNLDSQVFGDGVSLNLSARINLNHCHLSCNAGTGLYTQYCSVLNVDGGEYSSNRVDGIDFKDTIFSTIRGAHVVGNSYTGVRLGSLNGIDSSTVVNNLSSGITGKDECRIINNYVQLNFTENMEDTEDTEADILVSGKRNVISGNITDYRKEDSLIVNPSATTNQVDNNVIWIGPVRGGRSSFTAFADAVGHFGQGKYRRQDRRARREERREERNS